MKQRTLGRDLVVSAIGLGCMGMSQSYGPPPSKPDLMRFMAEAVDRGVTLFDTAESYGPFVNEELVGEALAPWIDQVTIATKFGYAYGPNGESTGVSSQPENMRRALEGSLRRLNVETINLYYQHRVDPDVPIEVVAETVRDFIAEGKVRYFGMSEAAASTISRAHAVQPVTALQSEYSLFTRGIEAEILPTIEKLGISLVPFSPLGKGFLTGTVDSSTAFAANDIRTQIPRFTPESIDANRALVDQLVVIAGEKNATPAQIALAWLLARKPWIVPIPGTRRIERLEENIGAADIELTNDDLQRIETELLSIPVHGDRYPPHLEATTNL